ncbi:unnamed protein product [Cyclocybe aegerita]|uniref:Lysine-specific metallo-endopeptidase domain-containing protein n=1 Tax=Cyclocybe aegerita TaxID=1973307 RepID=A0A8S0W2W9_CYCAE|nr:unnamed protein product [Cyclocybe aegerita]
MFSVKSLLVSLVLTAVSVSATPALSLSLSGGSTVKGVEHLTVKATITNTGDETLKLLSDPRSLLSKRPVNKFRIADANGARPTFTGVKVKYSPEVAAKQGAYTVLAPGASIEVDHDLSQGYNFSACGAGSFDFEGDSTFYIVKDDDSIGIVHAEETSAYTAQLSGNLAIARRDEQTAINSAVAAAETYASSSYNYLVGISATTNRYSTWFGTYTAARKSTVQSHFNLINGNDFSSFTYDCTCTDSAYAYVYAGTFGRIYFCNAFWNAPTTGTDSKAGTIIHEASHFTRNGGTDDHAYGQTAAQNLARSNPALAVMNADSHEYFAENTPART